MRRIVSVAVMIALCGGIGVAIANWQWIRDAYVVQTSDVQPAAAQLESRLSLTSKADFIYQASVPEVLPAESFNQACSKVQREESIVLGCYARQRFYVFDVSDERLAGVKEVTAAHELLHAVYERLSSSEKAKINSQVLAVAKTITDERFQATLAQYKQTEPDQIANELHSILGTEISSLPPELEAHYKLYFRDRAQLVAYAKQYADTFTSLDAQIKSYDTQLQTLKDSINSLEDELSQRQVEITAKQQELTSLRSSRQIAEYNSRVPIYNQLISNYNSKVSLLKQSINEYNQLVEKRNGLATTQNDLAQELNSNYQPLH